LLFAAACVFATFGIAYATLQRPGLSVLLAARSPFWSRRTRQRDFLLYCFAPLCLAALCFTVFWAWLPEFTFELPLWWALALGGAVLHLSGWMMSRLVLKQFGTGELVAVLLTGALGGLGLWFVGREAFRNLSEAPGLELYVTLPRRCSSWFSAHRVAVHRLEQPARGRFGPRMVGSHGAWFLIGVVAWSAFFALAVFAPTDC
jgi:hypothetical protein